MMYRQDATVVLIGMRGVGKTTLGLIASTSLRRPFIDADSAFKTLHGPIHAYVAQHGWSAFRDRETEMLERLLRDHPTGYVIATGGGVVDRERNRELLAAFEGPILHVVRDKTETVNYLVDEDSRCALLLPLHQEVIKEETGQAALGRRGEERVGEEGAVL